MAREIGSEFWDAPATPRGNDLFPDSTQWFLSGRSALQAIIKAAGERKSVSLPAWCCESVVKPFADANYDVRFYPVRCRQGGIVQEIPADGDVLLVMDFFGYSGDAPDLTGYPGIVVRDVAHSLFSKTYHDADFYFGSLRKWCGVWTGGYAWTETGTPLPMEANPKYDDNGFVALRREAMQMKSRYVRGDGDKRFLDVFEAAEACLENVGVAPAAERDIRLARTLDVELVRNRRRANAEVIRSAFPDWLIFPELRASDCPMFVPVLVPHGKRDALRKFLITRDIYCPVHWPPSRRHALDEKTATIYQNELSLVCDQRYTEKDMGRMVEAVRLFMEE